MNILVTGGCGYIGSHTCCELLNKGHNVIIIDNLSNSKKEVVNYIKEITGRDVTLYIGDVCDKDLLRKIFNENKIDSVIHFAGYKAVGESVKLPLKYYRNNLDSTLSLCEVMSEFDCKNLVFSSSATVYGIPKKLPIKEDFPLSTTNPYGTTKLMIERILKDLYTSDNTWHIALLRYFNPIGAHSSGLLGEDPNGIPNNLMPYIVRVACGQLEELSVFGGDYNTPDGTCIRDYLHVVDLAKGHIKALDKLDETNGVYIYNLGTGVGYSVLDVVNTFVKATGKDVPYKITQRRAGDLPEFYADATKAEKELGWKAEKNLEDMCRDSWHYIEVSRKNG